jgi:hypothetical protein
MFNLEEYTTVRERVIEFWNRNPNGRIETEILEWSDKRFIVAARLYRNVEDTKPFSTGLAHEAITDRGVNKDFALENGATSAIGIACANANIGIEKHKASREEMSKVAPNHPALKVVKDQQKPAPQDIKEGDVDYWTTPIGASVKTTLAPVTLDAAMATVTEILGTAEAMDAPSCNHGHMEWRTGHSAKTGKDWAGFFCATKGQSGGMDKCPTHWYNLSSSGKWEPQKARV